MASSVVEQLKSQQDCEHVLDCLYGLTGLERDCYQILLTASDAYTAAELAETVERDHSTVSRALNTLESHSLIIKTKQTYSKGGYEYVYESRELESVVEEMNSLIEQWCSNVLEMADEFNSKYQD